MSDKPPYDAPIFCNHCGATPIENTTLCPNCSGQTPHIIPHKTCPICGAPLGIRNETMYENWTQANGRPEHDGNHLIIERTNGGTPKKIICPTWGTIKLTQIREQK